MYALYALPARAGEYRASCRPAHFMDGHPPLLGFHQCTQPDPAGPSSGGGPLQWELRLGKGPWAKSETLILAPEVRRGGRSRLDV